MKPYLLLACTFILLLSFGAAAQPAKPQEWKRYTTARGEFSVELPTVPSMTTSGAYRHEVDKERWQITFGVYAEGLIYEVNVYENIEGQSLSRFITEVTANSPIDGLTEVVNHGVVGKQYLYKTASGAEQFFATDKRLYRFRVFGAITADPQIKRFFASIVLGPNPDGIVVGDGPGIPFKQDEPDEPVYTGKQIDRKARLGIKPEPEYTEEAKQNQITGTVVLRVVFTSAGNVSDIRIISGLPYGLTDRAIEAAKKIKFFPAMKDGKNVSMWMQLEYNFNLY